MSITTERHPALPSPAVTGSTSPPVSLDVVLSEIKSRRDEFQDLSHVPRDVVALMKRAGIYRASTPRLFGGDALPPHEFLRIVERIAEVDGSAAWVSAFGSSNTYLAALPLETQRKIYASGPDQVNAGGLYPMQKAVAVPGGWRATGQWRFASGCMGADWIGIGIGVEGPDGSVTSRMAVCAADEVEIVPNWDVVGMQGTGSYDIRVRDKFYPEEWTCVRNKRGEIDEPLFRYPAIAYQAEVHAVVNLGLARAALDTATGMSGSTKTMTGAPRLADRAYYRIELARAEAKWRSARAFFYEEAERAWAMLVAGDAVSREQTNLLRLSATNAAHCSADVVQAAYRVAGMSAIQSSHRLQHIVRDSMVVIQHATLSEGTYDSAGAMFAGVPPPPAYP